MRTLIIHPDDRSTDFLCHIYENMDDADIITDPWLEEEELADLIPYYDRLIFLGHGSPFGLFGRHGYIVSDYHADLLRGKNLVCIWCNADQFMLDNDLRGFFSGMFISEVGEASCYGIRASQEQVDLSNDLFAKLLGIYIDNKDRLEIIKEEYNSDHDKVMQFNNERLYDDFDNDIVYTKRVSDGDVPEIPDKYEDWVGEEDDFDSYFFGDDEEDDDFYFSRESFYE